MERDSNVRESCLDRNYCDFTSLQSELDADLNVVVGVDTFARSSLSRVESIAAFALDLEVEY